MEEKPWNASGGAGRGRESRLLGEEESERGQESPEENGNFLKRGREGQEHNGNILRLRNEGQEDNGDGFEDGLGELEAQKHVFRSRQVAIGDAHQLLQQGTQPVQSQLLGIS